MRQLVDTMRQPLKDMTTNSTRGRHPAHHRQHGAGTTTSGFGITGLAT